MQLKEDKSAKIISKPGINDVWVQNSEYQFGYYETAGNYRGSQEDALAWQILPKNLFANLSPVDIAHRLWTTYRLLDEKVCALTDAGSTASTTIYDGKGHLITATLADAVSFVALYDEKDALLRAERLNSVTHKATHLDEAKRVAQAGGFVIGKRVMGKIAVSRAIGPNAENLKAYVTSEATLDIISLDALQRKLTSPARVASLKIIAACDGFTDGVGDDAPKAVHETYLTRLLTSKPDTCNQEASLALHLADDALQVSTDNVSVAVQTISLQSGSDLVNTGLFLGIYDGNNGKKASHYVADHVCDLFIQQCQLSAEEYSQQPWSVNNHQATYNRDNPLHYFLQPEPPLDKRVQEAMAYDPESKAYVAQLDAIKSKVKTLMDADQYDLAKTAGTLFLKLNEFYIHLCNEKLSFANFQNKSLLAAQEGQVTLKALGNWDELFKNFYFSLDRLEALQDEKEEAKASLIRASFFHKSTDSDVSAIGPEDTEKCSIKLGGGEDE